MNKRPPGTKPDTDAKGGYFPLPFFRDFLNYLKEDPRVQVITYDDLAWEDDHDYERGYPEERQRWQQRLRDGTIDPTKIYVLLQHDVDSHADRTMRLLEEEERLGVRSNVMIFRRRVDRKHMRETGQLRYTEYEVDHEYLVRLEQEHRFLIAYHSNAHERALFDMDKAQRIVEEDIAYLQENFDIRFFSAHGGTPSPAGLNNRDVPLPKSLHEVVRWIHNGHTPWFTSQYSDGGINSPTRDPNKRDLRDFVKTWKPGERYRVLTHPQYYSRAWSRSPRLSGAAWYEEVLSLYSSQPERSAWDLSVTTQRKRHRRSFLEWFRRNARSTNTKA